jgi:predicted O-methyltransferase YrrM
MSAWMAGHVAPDGQIVAIDLDLSVVNDARASSSARGTSSQSRSIPVVSIS